jgi:superfamily I DNA/RNA helicase
MSLTQEQQTVLDHVVSDTSGKITLVSAVAGSGKTHLLVETAKAIKHTNGLVLCYNKSIATEASKKFPKTTNCITTHALAYSVTVKQFGLKLGTFTYRNITERLDYEVKCILVETLRRFFLSSFTSFDDFLAADIEQLPEYQVTVCKKYIDLMEQGKIECTHDFYLKLYHILLSTGAIEYDPFDFIFLDEAGDLNPVTLAIFQLLPSPRKVAVGDAQQNIYAFNHTINAFEVLTDVNLFTLTQSFRVPRHITERVQAFCQRYIKPDMEFVGYDNPNSTITSSAYLTRTNGALVKRIIELVEERIPFGLVRSADEIFKLPLMLCYIKRGGFISNLEYKHLQHDYELWYDDPDIKAKFTSPFTYIASLYPDDAQLSNAIKLLINFNKQKIIDAHKEAKHHEKLNQYLTLATIHSCKGLEFDEVYIADDVNNMFDNIQDRLAIVKQQDPKATYTPADITEFNLMYVAATRAKKTLNNARYLNGF